MRTMDVVAGGGGRAAAAIYTMYRDLYDRVRAGGPRAAHPTGRMSRARRVDRPYSVAHTSARGQLSNRGKLGMDQVFVV